MTKSINYMLTITNHNNIIHIEKGDLDLIVMKLQKSIQQFVVKEFSYENSGKHKQLHMHLIILVPHNFRFSPRWTSLDGFQLRWKKVFHYQKALNYIYKDQNGSKDGTANPKYAQNQESILWSNHFNHVLCFDSNYYD